MEQMNECSDKTWYVFVQKFDLNVHFQKMYDCMKHLQSTHSWLAAEPELK